MRFYRISLVAVIIFVFSYSHLEAASFDCAKARTTLEKTICNDSALNDADARLGKVYSQLRKSLSKSQAKKLKREQRAWLKQRTRVCSSGNSGCLLSLYESRIADLSSGSSSESSRSGDKSNACYDKAQTQLDLNECANLEYGSADKELNRVYQSVIRKHKDDGVFINKLKQAQQAWIKFRDAEMEAVFPHNYGSASSMCWSLLKTSMTVKRMKQLRIWLDGVEEGDVCSGSYPIKE